MTTTNSQYCGKCGNEKLHHADRGFVCEWCEHVATIAELVSVLTSTVAEFDRQIAAWSDTDEGDSDQAQYYHRLRAPLVAALEKLADK